MHFIKLFVDFNIITSIRFNKIVHMSNQLFLVILQYD